MKFLIRKLVFLGVLVSLVMAPFLISEYKSIHTTDPYILIAREVEAFELGGVDVLFVRDKPNDATGVEIFAYMPDYPDWSLRKDRVNFERHVLQAIIPYGFTKVIVVMGWDFPPEVMMIQGLIICEELRQLSCTWNPVPSVRLGDEFIQWPGIGNP